MAPRPLALGGYELERPGASGSRAMKLTDQKTGSVYSRIWCVGAAHALRRAPHARRDRYRIPRLAWGDAGRVLVQTYRHRHRIGRYWAFSGRDRMRGAPGAHRTNGIHVARAVLGLSFVGLVIPASASGAETADQSAELFMPDGQVKSHSVRVYVNQDISAAQQPRLRLLRDHSVTVRTSTIGADTRRVTAAERS